MSWTNVTPGTSSQRHAQPVHVNSRRRSFQQYVEHVCHQSRGTDQVNAPIRMLSIGSAIHQPNASVSAPDHHADGTHQVGQDVLERTSIFRLCPADLRSIHAATKSPPVQRRPHQHHAAGNLRRLAEPVIRLEKYPRCQYPQADRVEQRRQHLGAIVPKRPLDRRRTLEIQIANNANPIAPASVSICRRPPAAQDYRK